MFGLETLDVGIGMALMFLFVSLIVSAVREFGESLLKTRAVLLERGIREMMGECAGNYSEVRAVVGRGLAELKTVRASVEKRLTAEAVAAKPEGRERMFAGVASMVATPAAVRTDAMADDAVRQVVAKVDKSATTVPNSSATGDLYSHPLIASLYRGDYGVIRSGKLPCYIPSANFARAALDLAWRAANVPGATGLTAAAIRKGIRAMPDGRLQQAMLNALNVAGNDIARAHLELEKWFDGTMDRVSGWYKRRTQFWLFFLGLACAALMNIDAVTVMQQLSTDKALRAAVVGEATKTLADEAVKAKVTPAAATETASVTATAPAKPATPAKAAAAASPAKPADAAALPTLDGVRTATAQMGTVAWPIGWTDTAATPPATAAWYDSWLARRPGPQYRIAEAAARRDGTPLAFGTQAWASIVLGWLVTAVGVTFGAAFWFDVLNKFMVVRSTVKPAEKSPREKSKD